MTKLHHMTQAQTNKTSPREGIRLAYEAAPFYAA